MLKQRSCASALQKDDTSGPKEILHREIQVIRRSLKQRSCTSGLQDFDTSGPKGSPDTEILHKAARLQDPDKNGPEGSWYRDPHTEIFHKWYYRFLIQVVRKSGPTGSWNGSSIPIQVVQKDPHTEILHKWSAEILQKWSCTILDPDTSGPKDPDAESVVLQHPDRSGRTGAWYRDLAQVVLQDDAGGPKES